MSAQSSGLLTVLLVDFPWDPSMVHEVPVVEEPEKTIQHTGTTPPPRDLRTQTPGRHGVSFIQKTPPDDL